MKQNEFDDIMDRFLDGAAKVRAKKYENRIVKSVHRHLSARIISQMWDEDKKNVNAA